MIAGLSVRCWWCHAAPGVRCDQWRLNNSNPRNVRCVGPRHASHPSRVHAEREMRRERERAADAAHRDRWWSILAWHKAGRPGTIADFIAAGGAS